MATETPETPTSTEPPVDVPRPILKLHVLPLVTEWQGEHGLRHSDYQRYRQYCTRRLERLYHHLKLNHGAKKYVERPITADKVLDERYLHIMLLLAERAWSYFMQLKHLVDENVSGSRKLFHSRSRLRKAAAHALALKDVASAGLCDPRTELEATAYADWLSGSVAFEMQKWDEAIERLQRARFIYEKLSTLCDTDHRVLYTQRIDEIEANVRFSAFSKSGSAGLEDLLKMQQAARIGALADELASKIDLAVAHTRQTQSEAVAEIVWHGQAMTVRNERLREHLQRARAKEFDIDQKLKDDATADLPGLYDELFMAYGEAARVLSDDLHAVTAKEGKNVSQKVESSVSLLKMLQNYVTYLKLSRMMERTQTLLVRQAARAADKVHLYDTLLQNVADIADLPQQRDDPASVRLAEAQVHLFKGFRCHNIAECQRQAGKIAEALALYDRAASYAIMARSHLADCEGDVTAYQGQVEALLTAIRGDRCILTANRFLETQGGKSAQAWDTTKPILDQSGTYSEDLAALKQCRLVDFPPEFQTISCKPLFFDLANNHLAFPALEARMPRTAMGMLKGLFWKS
eukprot:m.226832 g.226832  ORF g.226832 m.226832 type:complete len:577 (+) comp11490_c0_seq1:121-1851(+)